MSTTFLNSFDMPLGSPLTDAPSLRPKFVDPMRTTTPMSPASQYIAALDPANFTSASPRLMRTTTPRKTSSSPSASSPRMPRYQAPTYGGAHDSSFASVQLASSFRSTPTVASSAQSYSSMSSAFSMSSSRFSTPVRSVASTPSRLNAMATPPSTGRGSSRPSSPAPSARAPRARSPVLTVTSSPVMMMNSSSYGAPLTPRSSGGADHHHQLLHHHQQQATATMTPRQLLRELASTWKSRGSENQQAFKEGGYMTVNPGDTLQNRYELIVKLGWGEFSTVWLAFDRKATSLHRTFVAVKIAKCSPEVVRGTKYECCLLAYVRERVSRSAPVASLLDVFEANGKYGAHLCMSMPLLGSNMLCVIEQFKAKGRRRRTEKELTLVKEITAAVLKALGHLENANVLHTDLKPENVLVSAPDAKVCASIAQYCRTRGVLADDAQLRELEEGDGRVPVVTLADFGLSLLLEPSSNTEPSVQRVTSRKELVIPKPGHLRNERGMLIQTREYRAPEVLFGADFNCRTDVWSLGCMAYELITGDFLMDPKKKTRVERDMDVEHIAMMMQILGPVPGRITTGNGKHIRRYFDTTGAFLYADKYASYPRRSIAAELESFLEPAEAERAAQFIMSCFTYDPVERCHANDLLRHSWLRSLQL